MKRGIKRIFVSAMMLTMLIPAQASAGEIPQSKIMQQEDSILLPAGINSSKDEINGMARGIVISSANSEIIDEEDGKIGVLIETRCHVECQKIRNIAILDRYNEETGQWVEQERRDFTETKDDYPDEIFSHLSNGFTIENQETGYYYRVRGIHNATSADGKTQTSSTRTEGILVTGYGG